MKVSEIRYVLEKALSQLNRIESPNEVKMCHTIDTGGYGGDCEEIYEFDLGLSYDVNYSELRTASNRRGGLEISLTYIFKKYIPNLRRYKICPNYM